MRTQEYVNECIKSMANVDKFGTKKEIKELPNILRDNEELLYITSGVLDGNTWLISCTNERIIFLDKGMVFGTKQKEIPLDKINSIEHTKGLLLGTISIWDGAAKFEIKNVSNASLPIMVDHINQARDSFKNRNFSNNSNNVSVANDDIASQITNLAKLRDQGIITEEEFQQGKAKILQQ